MNYTYIVKCSDETYYTGWTNNLEKRIQTHNAGKGAKYTKVRRPVELVYYEEFAKRRGYATRICNQATKKMQERRADT